MKTMRLCGMALLFLTVLTRCSTDFDLTSDYKEIPVIYALLDLSEPVQYFRVQKAYLDPETSALIQAGISDSIYYGSYVNVSITELASGQTFALERINGDTLSPPIVKESGDFSSSPNILYRYKGALNPDSRYALRIENTKTGKVITSETNLVKDFNVLLPSPNLKVSIVSPNNPLNIIWSVPDNGKAHDLYFRFNYGIAAVSDPLNVLRDTFIEFPVFRNVNYSGQGQYKLPFEVFYNSIQSRLDPDPTVVRHAKSVTLTFIVGNEDLTTYLDFANSQGGITSSQTSVLYTNLSEGAGVFASRISKSVTANLTDGTKDSIACGSITGNLGFIPSITYPFYPDCQ